jgi:DNA polymerase-3 subunit delta'
VHELAASVQGREGLEGFETLLATTFDWIDRTARENAALPDAPRRLANLAQVWEKIAASARETQTFNLDRRPLVLMMFSDLSEAVRALRA